MISEHYFGRAAITVLQPFVQWPYAWAGDTEIIDFIPYDEHRVILDANASIDPPSSELDCNLHVEFST